MFHKCGIQIKENLYLGIKSNRINRSKIKRPDKINFHPTVNKSKNKKLLI